jgi:hypothetical protein
MKVIRELSRASKENDTDYMTKHTIMESVKIDYLVEKYFGETSIAEEKELRTYFLHRMLRSI